MRIKLRRSSGSSAGSTSEPTGSPGKRTLTDAVRRRAKQDPAAAADPGAAFADATSGGGSEVPHRAEMESAFGEDFGGVSAHVGQADAMDSLGAHAAASGETVAFGSASPDKHTVAHELTHVVQHRRGSAGVFGRGGITDASDASEVEAERVASAVVGGARVQVAGGASDGVQLARKPWAERKAELRAAIDARIVQLTPAAAPPDAAPQSAAPPEAVPQSAAPPEAALPTAVPARAPDPSIVTLAELQSLRSAVDAASDDATMDAVTARGVTMFASKAPAERERFDGWVRDFGGVDGAATMDTFLQLTDGQAASIMADTSVGGLAQQMLMGTFESNWFKAKECLAFWRWPAGEPVFSRATGLEMMSALTKLRGAVHTEAQRLTQAAIDGEVAATAAKQQAVNPALAATMNREAEAAAAPRAPGVPAPPPAVEFKGSVGADTVTSDVDVSTGGINTEVAVRVYNEQFRALMQTAFDPGTVFDLNVYSKDFIFKPAIAEATQDGPKTITPTSEHPDVQPSAEQTQAQDNEQDIWAMVHVARHMPSKAEWDGYVAQVLAGIADVTERARQQVILATAWDRFGVFNRRLELTMNALKSAVDQGIAALGQSAWTGAEAEHFDEGALRMRAANKLYEQGLMRVKDIRAQIEACGSTDGEKQGRLAAELTGAISSAQLYANEVYGSRGGTVHAVVGVQMARKLGATAVMPPALWHESFNDNLGDVLKDYQHYGHAVGDHEPDYGYAAFKMGKYADRMVDAVPHLGEGDDAAYLSPADLALVQGSPDYIALAELSRQHVTAKTGPASNDPAALADDPYFSGFDAGRLATYKDHAITLGADVRARVAQHRSLPPPPEPGALDPGGPDAGQPPPAPEGAQAEAPQQPAGPDPRPVLGAMSGTVAAAVQRIEADIAAGPTQLKSAGAEVAPGGAAPPPPARGGRPLPEDVRAAMESSLGADFSAVRIHESPQAAELGARAYTQGLDIVFAPGEYHPESSAGRELLAHELTHVVQQGAGRVAAPQQRKAEPGTQINDDASLEAEADAAGALAARGESATITGATSSPGVQRDPAGPAGQGPNTATAGVTTTRTVAAQTYAQITAGTADDFMAYSQSRADWSMEVADPAHQAELRAMLTWLRAGDHRTGPLGGFTMAELIAVKADLPKLDAYCRAAADRPTVKVKPQTALAEMVAFGVDILKLEAALAGAILHQIFSGDEFDNLRADGQIDPFCNYVRACAPLLHAHEGVEIASFRTLAAVGDPASWRDVRDVRNTHRFQAAALDALRIAQAGNPGNKPLTLILHSAFDHNGAFHQDPNLTSVITNGSNHTIMIEGADSLDAIAARLPAIVALHGRSEPDPADRTKTVRRIDQLMLAGHGSATSIELAGTIAGNPDGSPQTNSRGNLVTADDGLDSRHDPSDPDVVAREARTRQFMQTLMDMMSVDPSSPHHRVVFNACLTASNEIPLGPAASPTVDPAATPDVQAQQMRDAIANSPSLVNTMRSVAPATGGPEIRGGNGSFGQVGLIDGSGALDIVADGVGGRTDDPELTNPDKLVYVEQGTDPGGCMSAVAERWAEDRVTLLAAVQRRRAAPKGAGWDETVIQAMYELVETRYASNGSGITILASQTEGFKELPSESQSHPWGIWHVRAADDWTLLQSRLGAHGGWTGNLHVPVVFFGGWMMTDAAKEASFRSAVGAMTTKTIRPFIHMPTLLGRWGSLVPATAGTPPDPGSLRLALRDLNDNEASPQANTRSFLSSMVTSHAFTSNVNAPLDGLHDDEWALRALGLHRDQAAGAAPSGPAPTTLPEANLDMDANGINESLVEPLSVNGQVRVATALHVRDQASLGGRIHASTLNDGDRVYLMGQTGTWYLLDHNGRRGYASKDFIDPLVTDQAGAVVDPAAAAVAPGAAPAHPTSMATPAILAEATGIDGRIAGLTGDALSEAQARKTALDAELRVRRLMVNVTCLSTSDWWTDEVSVRVTSSAGAQVTSLMNTSVAAGSTRLFSVPLATLVPLAGPLTVDVREEDLTSTDTVVSISFSPAMGAGVGVSASYAATVFFEETAGSVSTAGSTLPPPR